MYEIFVKAEQIKHDEQSPDAKCCNAIIPRASHLRTVICYLLLHLLNIIPCFSLQFLGGRGGGGGGCEGGDLVHVRPVPVGALQPAPGQAHALPLRQRHLGGEGAGQGSASYSVIELFIFISQTCNDDGCYGTCKTNGYCFKNVKRNETHVIKTYE